MFDFIIIRACLLQVKERTQLVRSSLYAALFKNISCLTAITLPRLHDRLPPLPMVYRIRVELCLQTDTAPLTIGHAVLSLFSIQIISGIKLESRAIRNNRHTSA